MFDSSGRLDIFDNFIVDRKLPKHLPTTRDGINESFGDSEMMSNTQFERQFVRSRRNNLTINTGIEFTVNNLAVGGDPIVRFTWLQRLFIRILHWVTPKGETLVFRPVNEPPRLPPVLSIHEFFSSIKNTDEELEVVDERVRGYEAALARAHRTGQVALVEQLEAGIDAVRAETQLHTMGLTRILTEDTLVQFVKKSPKGIRLDWVRNFTRHIPDEVLEVKTACDDRRIFDNYVVLHYDPEAKSWAETQEEKNARRDPILFGVLEGRRVLYFIGEWVDELCDLTLDQIADVLGRETVTEDLDPKNIQPEIDR